MTNENNFLNDWRLLVEDIDEKMHGYMRYRDYGSLKACWSQYVAMSIEAKKAVDITDMLTDLVDNLGICVFYEEVQPKVQEFVSKYRGPK